MGLVAGVVFGIVLAGFLVLTAKAFGLTGVVVILLMLFVCAIVGLKG